MAPRTRKAAVAVVVEDDGCPSLKLVMQKGPLSGQTIEYKPEARVQIGRVVRGNTLAIKDSGISTKHLLIQAENSDAGPQRWTATDLDSSNGTILNGAAINPSEPTALSDGDVIKIGEQTSIKVEFGVSSAGAVEVKTANVRRQARRGARKQVDELGVIDEDSELGLGIEKLGPVDASEKCVESGNNAGELGDVGEEISRGRRTWGSKAKEAENSRKDEIEIAGKVSLRRTRSSKNNENLTRDLNLDEVESVAKGSERVGVRRTRSSRKEENTDEPSIDLSVIEGKRIRRGIREKRNELMETSLMEKEKGESDLEEKKACEEEKGMSEAGGGEGETGDREKASGPASASGVKEGGGDTENASEHARASVVKEDGVEDGNEIDFEKTTLGEWFDYLEVYLPKQIIDSTEEMISEMRRKAERLHEFMLQQEKR